MSSTKQVNMRLDKDLIKTYEEMAEKEDRDRSYFMKKALVSFVADKAKPKVKAEVSEASILINAADKVIDYLNDRAGTNYKKAKSSRDPIAARLKDFSTEECFLVIEKKCVEWLGTDMAKYLRPQTLFQASKFESYLNQPEGSNHEASRPTSLAERSQQQTALILAQCEADEADNGFMGSHGAIVPPSMDQSGGREINGSEPIDGEFSVVGSKNRAPF